MVEITFWRFFVAFVGHFLNDGFPRFAMIFLGVWRECLKNLSCFIVSKVIKAEIGEIIFLSYFLAKRIKSQRGRN
jgi:hypothetical protein